MIDKSVFQSVIQITRHRDLDSLDVGFVRVLEGLFPVTSVTLFRLPKDGCKYEPVKGALRVSPAGLRHEKIGMKMGQLLLNFVEQHHLGEVYGSSAGFKLPNGDVRSPDVSFVSADRLPDGQTPEGFAEIIRT